MIAFKWSKFAYPWYWKPRLGKRRMGAKGYVFRWGYLYLIIGDEGSLA